MLAANSFMRDLESRLVPSIVDRDTFWSRYFFRLHVLEEREQRRSEAINRVSVVGAADAGAAVAAGPPRDDAEEDLEDWGDDDDDDAGDRELAHDDEHDFEDEEIDIDEDWGDDIEDDEQEADDGAAGAERAGGPDGEAARAADGAGGGEGEATRDGEEESGEQNKADEGGSAAHALVGFGPSADDVSNVSKSTASSQSEWCVVKDNAGSGSGSGSASVGEAEASEPARDAEAEQGGAAAGGAPAAPCCESAPPQVNESDEDWGDEDE